MNRFVCLSAEEDLNPHALIPCKRIRVEAFTHNRVRIDNDKEGLMESLNTVYAGEREREREKNLET